jgi:hypothetical protein
VVAAKAELIPIKKYSLAVESFAKYSITQYLFVLSSILKD